MESRGWRVMRVYLSEIDEELDSVVAAIEQEIAEPGSMLDWGQRTGQPSAYPVGVDAPSPPGLPASGEGLTPSQPPRKR
jgi:hypothetical protein